MTLSPDAVEDPVKIIRTQQEPILDRLVGTYHFKDNVIGITTEGYKL